MVTNMLKAISQMLDIKGADEIKGTMERVWCAKIMLDEIIKGMEPPPTTTVSASQVTFQPPLPNSGNPPLQPLPLTSALTSALEPKEPEYTMEIDPITKGLKWMRKDGKNLLPTQLLMIDGKQVEYAKAIGMTFKQLKVVEDAE